MAKGPPGAWIRWGFGQTWLLPVNLQAGGETGHGHWSHRHGSLLERGRFDQISGRKPVTGMTMCVVEKERQVGQPVQRLCGPREQGGPEAVEARLQKLLELTLRGLEGHSKEGGEPATGPWELPEKAAPFTGQGPAQRERERDVFVSVGFSARVCVGVSVCIV